MRKEFLFLLITAFCFSCTPGGETPPPVEFFISHVDSVLKNNSPDEYRWYLSKKNRAITLDSILVNDSLSLSNDEYFLGSFSYSPLPVWCELYSVNLQGTEDKEYFIIVSPSPLMEGGGFTYLLFFDDNTHENKFLDSFIVSTDKNSFAFDLKKMTSGNYFDLVVYSDIGRSVYDNAAARVLHLENNSVKEIFLQTTRLVDHLSDTIEMEAAQLTFMDLNGDSIREIQVRHVRSAGIPGSKIKMETVSKSETIYYWDAKLKKFRN